MQNLLHEYICGTKELKLLLGNISITIKSAPPRGKPSSSTKVF